MSDILDQVFYLGQSVQPTDMNDFYNSVATKLNCFFPISPAICSGLGYSQASTSNIITFNAGYLRFVDQPNELSDAAQATYAPYDGQLVTITCPSGTTQYIVAILSITTISDSQLLFSSTISPTSMTLAQIAAQANPSLYLPLYTITNNSGVYTLGMDANCAYNYAQIIQNIPYATELIAGIIQIATNAEAKLGTNSTKAIVPSSLAYVLLDYATKDQVDTDLSLYAKLLSPLFQGNPTRAISPFLGDNSNALVTSEWVNGVYDFDNGYMIFQNGLCLQWGLQAGAGSGTISFNFSFTDIFIVLGTNMVNKDGTTIALFNFAVNQFNYNQTGNFSWLAIGYKDLRIPPGTNWSKSNYPINIYSMCPLGLANNSFFAVLTASTGDRSLYKGSANGSSFIQIKSLNGGTVGTAFSNIIYTGKVIFFAGQSGQYSSDGGNSFLQSTGIPVTGTVGTPQSISATYNPLSGSIIAGTFGSSGGINRLYLSTNNAASFTEITSKIPKISLLLNIVYVPTKGYIVAIRETTTLDFVCYVSDDDGTTFTELSRISAALNPNRTGLTFVGGKLYNLYGLYDNGVQTSGGNIGQVFVSSDLGVTWEPINILLNGSAVSVTDGYDNDGNYIYVIATVSGYIYRAFSNGQVFTQMYNFASTAITAIAFINGTWVANGAGAYVSNDLINWFTSTLPTSPVAVGLFINPAANSIISCLGTGTAQGYIYYSSTI